MTIESQLRAEKYRRSFHKFYIDAFQQVLDPASEYLDNWHTKYLCDLMQKEAIRIINKEERVQDIIINVPIRSGKSLVISVAFNAWVWTICPTFKLITASYSATLSVDLSKKTRDLIKSNWYQEHFDIQLKDDQDTKAHFENTSGGFRIATSTGGSITGKGSDMIIADDLVNPEEADSKIQREGCNSWYDTTLYTRLNNAVIGSRIIVMQRLHDKDLTGHLLSKGDYNHICIPAELSKKVKPAHLADNYIDGRFFPKRFTEKVLADYLKILGARVYAAQLLQSPKILTGNIIKVSKFKYLDEQPKINRIIQAMDTAFKTAEKNDYSVCMTWGSFRSEENPDIDSYYIMSVLRDKFEFPDLKIRMEQIAKKFKPYKIIIEDAASGQSLIQEFKKNNYLKPLILPVKPDTDKVSRAYSITTMVEDGLIYLPRNAQWLSDLIDELSLFDNGDHDDQVDVFVYGLQYFSKKIGDHAEPNLRVL